MEPVLVISGVQKIKEVKMDQFDSDAQGNPYLMQWNALSAWFLGPRAENSKLFNGLILRTFLNHEKHRQDYFPTDPGYVTKLTKASEEYQMETKRLEEKLAEMNSELSQSTPAFSPRFQGHMNWDITMPSYLGYISGMLWNSNNVDVTMSPVTTPYEILVGDQISDMIGFDRSLGYDPWGHITSGGSVANIEALWASRNLKFYPLSLQDTIRANPVEMGKAMDFEVLVPAKEEPDPEGGNLFMKRRLSQCSTWQLLNIDVDEACIMAEGVATCAGITMDRLSELVHPHSYTSVGIAAFLTKHGIKSPRCFCPATCHYSWHKAVTVLGLGEDNLILVKVDKKARQDVEHLELLLQECVEEGVPVISVTAVMGSTEESAMDPLTDILDLRNKFRGKGLNFVICADAAWGAYLRSILIDPDEPEIKNSREKVSTKSKSRGRSPSLSNGRTQAKIKTPTNANLTAGGMSRLPKAPFVPTSPLNEHTKKNLNALRFADTVTSDPHKSGYCPYPAGSLSYRNGTMKEFVKLAAPEVFHGETDLNVAVNGLEGSKPGAAAAGVLLSHRVIGLDKYGYGRILGQCVFGSKIFYCTWTHLSKPTDPFVIAPILPCTEFQKEQMKALIIGKTNLQIYMNKTAMDLLSSVGPDALINKLGLNLKVNGVLNNDVNESRDFSQKVASILTVNVGKDVHRVPMVILQTLMETETHGESLLEFENSIGLTKNNDKPFGCIVNTVMNPWQTSSVYVSGIGAIFRQACFIAQGWKTDSATRHRFVVCGDPQYSEKDGCYFFANLCATFGAPTEQYNVIVKFSILLEKDAAMKRMKTCAKDHLFISNQTAMGIYHLLEVEGRKEDGLVYDVFDGLLSSVPTYSIPLRMVDVVNMKHFLPANDPDLEYPETQTYFMFGDGGKVFLSHTVTKQPDFQQVVEVSKIPMTSEKDQYLIWYGLPVTFPDLTVDKQNTTAKPFEREDRTYKISFAGRKQEKREMDITLKDNTGWFDTNFLSSTCTNDFNENSVKN